MRQRRGLPLALLELKEDSFRRPWDEDAATAGEEVFAQEAAVPCGASQVYAAVRAPAVDVSVIVIFASVRHHVQSPAAQAGEIRNAGTKLVRREVLQDVMADDEIKFSTGLEINDGPALPAVLAAELVTDVDTCIRGADTGSAQRVTPPSKPAPDVEYRLNGYVEVI